MVAFASVASLVIPKLRVYDNYDNTHSATFQIIFCAVPDCTILPFTRVCRVTFWGLGRAEVETRQGPSGQNLSKPARHKVSPRHVRQVRAFQKTAAALPEFQIPIPINHMTAMRQPATRQRQETFVLPSIYSRPLTFGISPLGALLLELAGREVVGARPAENVLERAPGRDVAAAAADDDGELDLVVDLVVRAGRDGDRLAGVREGRGRLEEDAGDSGEREAQLRRVIRVV